MKYKIVNNYIDMEETLIFETFSELDKYMEKDFTENGESNINVNNITCITNKEEWNRFKINELFNQLENKNKYGLIEDNFEIAGRRDNVIKYLRWDIKYGKKLRRPTMGCIFL